MSRRIRRLAFEPLPDRVKRPLRLLRRLIRFSRAAFSDVGTAPDLFHVYHDLYRHPDLDRQPGGWRYRGRFYPDYLTVGGASHAICGKALQVCRGMGIDVGAGLWPLPGAIPIDVWRGPGAGRPLEDIPDGSLDYVFSSHCLEHIDDWRGALAGWIQKLKSGGIIFLYLPHPSCEIWHPGTPFIGDAHRWIPTPELVTDALEELDCEVLDRTNEADAMQSFYVVGRVRDDLNDLSVAVDYATA